MRTLILCLMAAALGANAQNRIISTAPAITETLFALGLGARVVGVSTYCHFPAEAAAKPKIGTYLRPNVETILRLRPDLVIMERLTPQAIEQLRGSGVKVLQVTTGDLAANLKLMDDIAAATGTGEAGRILKARVQAALAEVRAAAAQGPRRSVLFIVGRTPGRLDGIIAVGKGSYLNELIEIAGGKNLLFDSAVTYPKLSLEAIVRLRPDVIIDMGDMADTVGVTEEHKRSVVELWRTRKDIRSQIHAVASDIFVVPGPRMAEAAREFFRLIQGDAKP